MGSTQHEAEESHIETFQSWRSFSQAPRFDVGLTIASTLRQNYGSHHVVRIDPSNCDLKGFADAAFANWTDEHFDGQLYDAVRRFSAPGSRTEKKDSGRLADKIRFGRARYEWEGKEFLVYTAEYAQTPFQMPVEVLFVLAPRGDKVVDGHHQDIDALLLACGNWTKELHDEIFVFDNGSWDKDGELYSSVHSSSWDDVVLDPETKSKLIEDVQGFFDNRVLYESFQVPWKRGVILHGVPGNGKTISIKALIKNLSQRQPDPIPALYVKSFDSQCNGQKWSILSIFRKARQMAPCVLIFEDLDSMITEEVRSYFLNEVDGLDSNDGILMIGSTNHLDQLDPAIAKRPSRFDRKYHFRLPNEPERALYCQYWFRKLVDHPLVAFSEDLCPVIAKLTEGFSFAYMKELFVTALLLLARGGPPDGDDAVVVEVPRAKLGAGGEEKTGRDKMSTDKGEDNEGKEPLKTKKTVPRVEVPESLQNNKLLQIITAQAQLLLDEMDNTEDESQHQNAT